MPAQVAFPAHVSAMKNSPLSKPSQDTKMLGFSCHFTVLTRHILPFNFPRDEHTWGLQLCADGVLTETPLDIHRIGESHPESKR